MDHCQQSDCPSVYQEDPAAASAGVQAAWVEFGRAVLHRHAVRPDRLCRCGRPESWCPVRVLARRYGLLQR